MKIVTLKNLVLLVALYFTVFSLVLGSVGLVDSDEKLTASGIVIVSKDREGTIISVILKAEDTAEYNCVLNETGIKLGETMDRRWVEATGIIIKEGEMYWFEVESYREVTEGLS